MKLLLMLLPGLYVRSRHGGNTLYQFLSLSVSVKCCRKVRHPNQYLKRRQLHCLQGRHAVTSSTSPQLHYSCYSSQLWSGVRFQPEKKPRVRKQIIQRSSSHELPFFDWQDESILPAPHFRSGGSRFGSFSNLRFWKLEERMETCPYDHTKLNLKPSENVPPDVDQYWLQLDQSRYGAWWETPRYDAKPRGAFDHHLSNLSSSQESRRT